MTRKLQSFYIIDVSQQGGKIPREHQEMFASVLTRIFTEAFKSLPKVDETEFLLIKDYYDEDKFCFLLRSSFVLSTILKIVDSLPKLWSGANLRVISKRGYQGRTTLIYLVVDDNSLFGHISQANHNKMMDAFLKNTTHAQRHQLSKHVWKTESVDGRSVVYLKSNDCVEELHNRIAALPTLWEDAKLRLVHINDYDETERLPPNISVMYFIDRNRVGGHFPPVQRHYFEWDVFKAIMDFMNSDANRPALGFLAIRYVRGDLCMFYDRRTAECMANMCRYVKTVPCPWPNGGLRMVHKSRYQYLQRMEQRAMRSASRLKKENFLRKVNFYIVNEKRTDGKFPRERIQLLERALGNSILNLMRASKAERPPLRITESKFIRGVYGLFIESNADPIYHAVEQLANEWTDERPRLITRAHRTRMLKKLWKRSNKVRNKEVFIISDKSAIFGKISSDHQAVLKECLLNASMRYDWFNGEPVTVTTFKFVNDSLEVYLEGEDAKMRIREILARMPCPWENAKLCLLPLGETEKYHIISVKLTKVPSDCNSTVRAEFYKERLGLESDYGLETHRWWLLQEFELENNLLGFKWCIDAASHEYLYKIGKHVWWNGEIVEVKYHKL